MTTRNLSEFLIDKAVVGHRYTLDELKDRLNCLSAEEVTISYADESEYTSEQDYALDFSSNTGYGTIFYLKTRTDKMYITEVSFTVDTEQTDEQKSRIKAEEYFVDIASKHEDYDDIIDEIRSLNSENEITDEDYTYLLENWDNLLRKYNL